MKKYVITGASGRIGNIISKELLAKGMNVQAIGRSAEKLHELVFLGANSLPGDINDRTFVTRAFQGADAVFCLLTANMQSNDVRAEQKTIAESSLDVVVSYFVNKAVEAQPAIHAALPLGNRA